MRKKELIVAIQKLKAKVEIEISKYDRTSKKTFISDIKIRHNIRRLEARIMKLQMELNSLNK